MCCSLQWRAKCAAAQTYHHLAVRAVPLLDQIGCHPLLCHFCLSPCHTINRVDHWGEVFVQLIATCEVLVFLLFFLIPKNLHQVLVPIASRRICISETEVENTQVATHPKAMMDASISTLFVYISKSGWLLLLTLAMLLWLLLLFLLLLLCQLLHHWSGLVCWRVAELLLLQYLSFVGQHLYISTAHV